MNGHFLDGQMNKLEVDGNGESLYFDLLNDSTLRGVNKLLCASIIMYFIDGNIAKINHLVRPEGSFTPPHLLEEDQLKLEGFIWREEEKPLIQHIYDWRTPKIREKIPFNFFDEPDVLLLPPTEDEIQNSINKNINSGIEN